jgi:hypothetical protein
MFLRKTFRCEVDAARQYNAWALQYRGRAARLNVIPEEDGVGDETA